MGEETYFIDYITRLLEKEVLNKEEESFNKTIVYGKDSSINSLISICKRYPIMSKYQLVILKEGQELSRKIEDLSNYVLNPLMTTILIVNYKYKTIDKRKKLFKNIHKFGTIIDCKKIYESRIPNWIVDQLKSDGFSIEYKACSMLVDYTGNDLKKINNQLNKLKIICSENKNITPNLIEENIGISKDFNVFELRNAIGVKNINKALIISNYLAKNSNKYPIQIILSSLFNFFIQIFQYHSLNNKSSNNVSSVLKINSFFVKDYDAASKHYSMKNISNILSLIKDWDLKSKGLGVSKISNHDLLRQLIIQIIN